jgi:hypothetical protein
LANELNDLILGRIVTNRRNSGKRNDQRDDEHHGYLIRD